MRTGTGHAPCHHGEILQGVFLDPRGRRCRGLVTLPLSGCRGTAEFRPTSGTRVTVRPRDRTKALAAARAAVAECAAARGVPLHGGELRLRGDVPIGLGMGSSTSDVVAAVRAVESSYGVALGPDALARLAVACEQASDPVMFGTGPLLFAQRQGRVLETFGGAWPSVLVVGCRTGGGVAVDTLSLPADPYPPEDVHAYERLRRLMRRAVAEGDAALLGRVCTTSARLNQRVLVKPELGELLRIAESTGAVGVQVAHSGNVAGLLHATDGVPPHQLRRRLRRCVAALRSNGIPVTRIFTPRPEQGEGDHGSAHHRRPRPSGVWCG